MGIIINIGRVIFVKIPQKLTVTTCERIAIHSIGTRTSEATMHIRAESGASAGIPQTFIDISAFLFRTAVVSLRTFALVRAW